MTDMRRWQASINYLYPVDEKTSLHPGRMEVYLASDAEAAIAAAEQECGERSHSHYMDGYAQGQRDMLAKCITLIEESVPWSTNNWIAVDERAAILAALRALNETQPNPSNRESIHDRTGNSADKSRRSDDG